MKALKFPKDVKSLQESSDVDRIVEVQIVTPIHLLTYLGIIAPFF
jgi:hypothetical protein